MAAQFMALAMDDSSEEELFKKIEEQHKIIGKLMFNRLQREIDHQDIIRLDPMYHNKKLIGIIAITATQNYEFICEPRYIQHIARYGKLYNNNLYYAYQEENTCKCIII
jgi:hypothetical protein